LWYLWPQKFRWKLSVILGWSLGCKENVDSNQLLLWVTNRIKAFRKYVGTSLEGFEEQITGPLLALEARKKNNKKIKNNNNNNNNKQQQDVGS